MGRECSPLRLPPLLRRRLDDESPQSAVSQRSAARFGVVDVFEAHRQRHGRATREGVHDVHRSSRHSRSRRRARDRDFVEDPIGKSLAIASFTGMQQPSRLFSDHVNAVTVRASTVSSCRDVALWNRYHQAPVGISDDLHVVTPFGHHSCLSHPT